MSCISRRLRSALVPAAVILGLLAVPGSALAAANDVVINDVSGVGAATAGSIREYTVTIENTSATDTATASTVSLSGGTVVGTTTVTGGDAGDAASFDCTAVSSCTITAGFDSFTADTVVHFHVQLDKSYDPSFEVEAMLTGDDTDMTPVSSSSDVVSSGGPSNLAGVFGSFVPASGVADKWVTKGSTIATTLTITNNGAGAADFAVINVSANGSANALSPDWAPNPAFMPTVTIGAGTCAPTAVAGECEIPTLAPGASVAIPVTIAGLTHFGYVSSYAYLQSKADNGGGTASLESGDTWANGVQITDGTIAEPHVGLGSAVDNAAGNTDVTFKGEVTNNGPAAITGGVVNITADSFKADGTQGFGYIGDAGLTQSIQKITFSNGAACVNEVNHSNSKQYMDSFECPITIAAGTRVTFEVITKFATAKADENGSVSAHLMMASYAAENSGTADGDGISLNVSKTQDLDVAVSSAALVGADRVAVQTVTVTNKGNTKSTGVTVFGNIDGGLGTFDGVDLPVTCTSIAKPNQSMCSIGDLEPGASKTVMLGVKAGTTLGSLAVRYTVGGAGLGTEINFDNNSVTQVMTIVKANAVPLMGVIVAKAPVQSVKKLFKTGLKTVVTVPSAATVKVAVTVTPKVAAQLGLIKTKTMAKAKKPLFYVIGTSTTKVAAAGKVTITTKLSKKYKAKLLKNKKKFAVKRTVTVTSTAPKTAGATSLTSQTLTFKK